MPLPTFMNVTDKDDLKQFEKFYLDQRPKVVEAIEARLPQLLTECESLQLLRDNWRLATLQGVSEKYLNHLHDLIVDTLTKSCRVRLTQLNRASKTFEIELVFNGREITRALERKAKEFRTVTDQKLRFISSLASLYQEYRVSFVVNCTDAYDEELRFVSWNMSERLPSVFTELSKKEDDVLNIVCREFGPLWTIKKQNQNPYLEGMGQSVASVKRGE